MKPLPSAPPTLEDSDIWLSIVVGYGLDWATAGVIFRDGDRRDAELMLGWTINDLEMRACGDVDIAKVKRGAVLAIAGAMP